HVQIAAKSTGNDEFFQRRRAHSACFEKNLNACANRGLGKLNLADVLPRQNDFASAAGVLRTDQKILTAAAVLPHTFRPFAKIPARLQNTGVEQGGDSIENSGATDANGKAPLNRVDLDSAALEKHAFNGARGGAHAVPDMRSFKSRPGSTRASQQAAVDTQSDFGVGADVDRQKGKTRFERAGADANKHGHVIATHVTGDVRRSVNRGTGGNLQAQIARRQVKWLSRCRQVGCHAQLLNRQTRKEMMHRRVSGDDHLYDLQG